MKKEEKNTNKNSNIDLRPYAIVKMYNKTTETTSQVRFFFLKKRKQKNTTIPQTKIHGWSETLNRESSIAIIYIKSFRCFPFFDSYLFRYIS